MPILSKKCLREFWEKHPTAEEPLLFWYRVTKKAQWKNLSETRKDFPHADQVGECTVFNAGGNKYRLITRIEYARQEVYLKYVLMHAEYDEEKWKSSCRSKKT